MAECNSDLAAQAVASLKQKELKLCFAESLTGGMISSGIVDVPGASYVLNQGLVTYSNEAKMRLLGVRKETLDAFGAVSPQTAADMAAGALFTAKADYALSVTGCAGDDDPNKGIATRARVRFRISMSDTGGEGTARKRARYLVPNKWLPVLLRYCLQILRSR
ncbi:MAG: CinA family protein [Clostridiales bacterium]|nr:CinA family protein [Clostridiales bacterium]